jgi:predicted glutamine amidotransferase
MCQLLGTNCAEPTDITFSFTGFAARGGVTDHHTDGWGIAFFENRACRLFIDHQSAATSPVATLVKNYPIKSKNAIAHIRKATQGAISLENCHPFMRELWGRHWIFAHNGDLRDYHPVLSGVYQPVGTTDSELAFCAIMEGLRQHAPGPNLPSLNTVFEILTQLVKEITSFGIFNFLLSNGEALFAYSSTRLHYIVRRWPFSTARLIDVDMTIDFTKHMTPEDCTAVIATQPLTHEDNWQAFASGDLLMFQNGKPALHAHIPVPEAVLARVDPTLGKNETAILNPVCAR